MTKSLLSSATLISIIPAMALSGGSALGAQDMPVTRVALFSSGVGYFEHRGTLEGDATVSLPFSASEVDDALKSLVIWDFAGQVGGAGQKDAASPTGGAGSPSVSYPSLEGLDDALRGLRIDLRGSPNVADILGRMRGAELSVDAPETIVGRIVSIEQRGTGKDGAQRPTLVLLSGTGLRSIALDEIASFRFTDEGIASDFDRALALVLGARDADRRVLDVRLPGAARREAVLGYIVAAPVWKVSYRLDLSGEKPWFQGWAIVDNPSQTDWKNVTLSLVSGKPVSFIQNLYAPLRLSRPILPLSIAGTAEARTFDSGFAPSPEASFDEFKSREPSPAMPPPAPPSMKRAYGASSGVMAPSLAQSSVETTEARSAGDQFEFTVKKPVTLERRRSAMLPLVAGPIGADKLSIWSADSGSKNPMLGLRVSNSLGMKLPAGPITVFDGGVYAGDALVEFLPEKDKRLLVYGQDLSVTGDVSKASTQDTIGVTVSRGVLVFSRRATHTRSYEFKNASATQRTILVEHPIAAGSELMSPSTYDEKTDSVYRFLLPLPAGGRAKLEVKERSPSQERIALSNLSPDSFLRFASSSEIPATIKDALKKAVELRKKTEDAKKSLADLNARRAEIASEQARYRQNLDTVGRDSTQGQQYLRRLMDSETEIDSLTSKIADAKKANAEAQAAYDGYIGNLDLSQ